MTGIHMHSNLVPVPARRHPHQVFLAALLMLSGVQILAGGPRPGSVNASLPLSLLIVWAGVLTVGGAFVVLAAIVKPHPALYLELAAHPSLSLMCGVYAASILMVAGLRAVVPAAITLAAALAFAVRAVQVFRTLIAVRQALRRLEESES